MMDVEGWDVVTLEDVCAKAINGGTPSTEVEKYWGGDIPWITGADILNQKVSKIRRYITEEAVRNSSTNVIPKGNLLVVTRTGVGKLAIAPFDVAVSQDFTGIIPNEKIKTEFLFWLLNNSANYFLDLTQGTSINGITRKDLMGFMSPIPPLPKQHQIAAILSTIDNAIEQTEAIIAKQQRIKTGLMQDLLTRGIDEHGNIRSEETHEFKDSPLGRIPVEWEVSPAYSRCLAVIDCKNRTPPESKDGHPVIRTPNVRASKFVFEDLLYTDSKSYKVWTARGKPQSGDVVITREAPFGEACMIPEEVLEPCLGQRIMMYKPDPLRLRNDFLLYAIYSERVQKRLIELAGGSTVGHVKVGDIRDLLIPYPVNIKEQDKIAGALNGSSNALERYRRELSKLRLIKTGLMQDLLTGKKRVIPLLSESQEASA